MADELTRDPAEAAVALWLCALLTGLAYRTGPHGIEVWVPASAGRLVLAEHERFGWEAESWTRWVAKMEHPG